VLLRAQTLIAVPAWVAGLLLLLLALRPLLLLLLLRCCCCCYCCAVIAVIAGAQVQFNTAVWALALALAIARPPALPLLR